VLVAQREQYALRVELDFQTSGGAANCDD
jgi:hypothetical protein